MSRKLITFLGTSPKDTVYEWQGKRYPGKVFAQALREFVRFDKMLVLVTQEAREKAYPVLENLGDKRIEPVDIKTGTTVEEMWSWFEKILQKIEDGDTVIFDITHGLRSIPFLIFIFAAYLKSARNVTIEAIYYGAFELGNKDANIPAPVIELSEFISMLDWLIAVNQFLYTGNAHYLAEQLEKLKKPDLLPLSNNVRNIALSLSLLRPRDIAEASLELPKLLKTAQNILPPPFSVMAQSLEIAYSQFGIKQMNDPWDHLRIQLLMINWYLKKEQYVHTLSMAREWLVSLLCAELKLDLWDKDSREEMEFLLSSDGIKKNAAGETVKKSSHWDDWKQFKYRKLIIRLWNGQPYELAHLRNDVLHSGFRKNPQSATEIIERTKNIIDEINKLAALYQLT